MDEVQETTLAETQWLKKHWPWVLLAVFMAFGFYLRIYHLDYPVIGYHNWKEAHYLTEAKNFAEEGFFKHGPFVPYWDLVENGGDADGVHADTFPIISIIVGFLFKLFGEQVWIARLVGVLFNVASIPLFYLILKRLFKREDLALTASALFAFNPLLVFFSRQVQLDSPAMFLMLLGTLYFVRWVEDDKNKDLITGTVFLTLGIVSKYSFVVMALPFFGMFPWKRLLDWRPRLKTFGICAAIASLFPIWFVYVEYFLKSSIAVATGNVVGSTVSFFDIINFYTAFTPEFWQTMKSFVADNFTTMGLLFALLGLVLMLLFRKHHHLGSKYALTSAGTGAFFFVILAYKLSGHSYHQFPYAPLIILLMAFFFVVIGKNIESLAKIKHSRWIIIAIGIYLLWSPSLAAMNRQFDTQFPGIDVAGKYIRGHSDVKDRFIHSSHQSHGAVWEDQREGFKMPGNVGQLQMMEGTGVKFILIYQWGFKVLQEKELWDYMKSNYHLTQFGFVKQGDKIQPMWFLLKKGGTFDENKLQELVGSKPVKTQNYEYTSGSQQVGYVDLE